MKNIHLRHCPHPFVIATYFHVRRIPQVCLPERQVKGLRTPP
jgi:hypothetical protein